MSKPFMTFILLLITFFVFVEVYTTCVFEEYGRYVITISTLRKYFRTGKMDEQVFKLALTESLLEHPTYKVFLTLEWFTMVLYIALIPAGLFISSVILLVQSKIVENIVTNKDGLTLVFTLLIRKLCTILVLAITIYYLLGAY